MVKFVKILQIHFSLKFNFVNCIIHLDYLYLVSKKNYSNDILSEKIPPIRDNSITSYKCRHATKLPQQLVPQNKKCSFSWESIAFSCKWAYNYIHVFTTIQSYMRNTFRCINAYSNYCNEY